MSEFCIKLSSFFHRITMDESEKIGTVLKMSEVVVCCEMQA